MKNLTITGTVLSLLLVFSACKKETSDLNAGTHDGGGINPNRTPPENGQFCLGNLPQYLLVFTDGSDDANWQGATKGFIGNVAVNGQIASERTSGGVPYAGNLYTNAASQSDWQDILGQNASQSQGFANETARITGLISDLDAAFANINDLDPTLGYESVNSSSLNGLNTQDGIAKIYVINITSGLQVSSKIYITGDEGDLFILRWDNDGNPGNGYQGLTKFQSGGGIVPMGELWASNFINVAGDISSSGGGNTPAWPYPQGVRTDNGWGNLITNGKDFNGGGFFTGYWLTTGDPETRETHSLSNAIFVGGWYTSSTKFSMTSGTSGVYVAPPAAIQCGN